MDRYCLKNFSNEEFEELLKNSMAFDDYKSLIVFGNCGEMWEFVNNMVDNFNLTKYVKYIKYIERKSGFSKIIFANGSVIELRTSRLMFYQLQGSRYHTVLVSEYCIKQLEDRQISIADIPSMCNKPYPLTTYVSVERLPQTNIPIANNEELLSFVFI